MNFISDVTLLEQKKILYDLVILSVDRQLFSIGTLTMKIRYVAIRHDDDGPSVMAINFS